eukprot:11063291-Ditylum_brightwellii.AAC.1
MSVVNPPDIITPRHMVNPCSQGDPNNNNLFETFVPVSSIFPIQNPYLPNGTLIEFTTHKNGKVDVIGNSKLLRMPVVTLSVAAPLLQVEDSQ